MARTRLPNGQQRCRSCGSIYQAKDTPKKQTCPECFSKRKPKSEPKEKILLPTSNFFEDDNWRLIVVALARKQGVKYSPEQIRKEVEKVTGLPSEEKQSVKKQALQAGYRPIYYGGGSW